MYNYIYCYIKGKKNRTSSYQIVSSKDDTNHRGTKQGKRCNESRVSSGHNGTQTKNKNSEQSLEATCRYFGGNTGTTSPSENKPSTFQEPAQNFCK